MQKTTKCLSNNFWLWLTAIAILIHFIAILVLGLSRHWGYMSSLNDLGVFDQALWGTLCGKWFHNTVNPFNSSMNWLGFHFNPILLLFVPFYACSATPTWLILAQALSLSISAWPIFILGKRVSMSDLGGFLLSAAYMMNPFLLSAAAWDFHPITLAVPFLAMGMLAIEKRDFRLLVLCSVFLLLCQEHLGLMVAGLGLLHWIKNGSWKPSLFLILVGMIWSVLVLNVIMPSFSPTGEHIMLGGSFGQLSRYSWLGNSMEGILRSLVSEPLTIFRKVMFEMGGARYIAFLLVFFLGYPLAAPEFVLPGLADLTANMLSANPLPRAVFSYHSVCLVPVFTIASVYGVRRISLRVRKFSIVKLVGLATVTNLLWGSIFAPFPLPFVCNVWRPIDFPNFPDPTVEVVRSALGEDSSISVQANIGAHFSQREEIYLYPARVSEVDAVVLRLESPTENIEFVGAIPKNAREHVATMLDAHLQMDRAEYIDSIESLLSNKQYGVLLWKDPWLVLTRGAGGHPPSAEIRRRLDQLKEEWLDMSKSTEPASE